MTTLSKMIILDFAIFVSRNIDGRGKDDRKKHNDYYGGGGSGGGMDPNLDRNRNSNLPSRQMPSNSQRLPPVYPDGRTGGTYMESDMWNSRER